MSANLYWKMEVLELRLKYTWRISRNASDHKTNFVVTVSDGQFSGAGEVAPNIRYGETRELIEEQFATLVRKFETTSPPPDDFLQFLQQFQLCNSLSFGLQSAYIHLICNQKRISVHSFLGLPAVTPVPTCYSIPVMPVNELSEFIEQNILTRFKWLKIKVGKEEAAEAILEVARKTKKPLLIDGNEAWTDPDELLSMMQNLATANIRMIEQPMPASLVEEYQYLKKKSPFAVFADESVTDKTDFEQLKTQFDGVNIKLMKSGGYFTALRQLQEAKRHGLQTMIGCMIETSLGISSAIHLCSLADYTDLDGFMILDKDPFELIIEENGLLRLVNN